MSVDPNRRRLLQGTAAAAGALAVPSLFHIGSGRAQSLPDPDRVLAGITPGNYVDPAYLERFGIAPDARFWDPARDWITTADWEAVRKQFMGTTVRLAVGAADAESVRAYQETFRRLSGIEVEVVPIADAPLVDRIMTDFQSRAGRFDAIQYFSPYLGDFAAPGYLHPLDEYVEKWAFPMDDFADTYRLNYAHFGDRTYGIPYDCDFRMIQVRGRVFRDITGQEVQSRGMIRTYDDLLRFAREVHKARGDAGVGMMTQRGFWATYTWQQVAAQYGMDMFDANWEPLHDSEASVMACEMIMALQRYAPPGVTAWGWPENRSAWLGGETVMNIAWQDQGNQATRPDQSTIADDDVISLWEPLGTGPGARFAPPNVAGSTSSVSTFAREPEAAFLLLAFLNTASLQSFNGANANGVGTGYRSVLNNPNFQKIMTSARVWAEELDYAWCAPRLPDCLGMDINFGNELNLAFTGNKPLKDALSDGKRRVRRIMERNGFYSDNPPIAHEAVADGLWLGRGKDTPV